MRLLYSIKPFWIEKILLGEKTIEVRTRKPIVKLPCEVLLYCTKGSSKYDYDYVRCGSEYRGNGYVVGKATLTQIQEYPFWNKQYIMRYGDETRSCLTQDELLAYGKGKSLFGLYLSDVEVFNQPKKLSEYETMDGVPLKRAPQSYCCIR